MVQYLATRDIEAILIARLIAGFPEAAVHRVAPATLRTDKPTITIRRTGGLERNKFVDQAHLDIHVYGTETGVNSLALRVQAYLNAQSGDSILKVTTSGPADLGGTPPRRFMYCDALMRREVREEITP